MTFPPPHSLFHAPRHSKGDFGATFPPAAHNFPFPFGLSCAEALFKARAWVLQKTPFFVFVFPLVDPDFCLRRSALCMDFLRTVLIRDWFSPSRSSAGTMVLSLFLFNDCFVCPFPLTFSLSKVLFLISFYPVPRGDYSVSLDRLYFCPSTLDSTSLICIWGAILLAFPLLSWRPNEGVFLFSCSFFMFIFSVPCAGSFVLVFYTTDLALWDGISTLWLGPIVSSGS